MAYIQNINHCFTNNIEKTAFEKILKSGADVVSKLKKDKDAGKLHLVKIAEETKDLEEINKIASRIRKSFETVVVAGTGGSSLSGQALVKLKSADKKSPKIIFADNVDPHSIEQLLLEIDIKKTFFIIISKSGSTLETVSQFGVFISEAKRVLGKNFSKNFLAITDKAPNPLRNLAKKLNIEILDHADVGGRFSGLSSVGLLPAAIHGLDIKKIRKGAAKVSAETFTKNNSDALKGASLNICYMQKNYSAIVMMPYVDRLEYLAKWHRQIWSESLGKDGCGNTPVVSMGTIDQHSQLQLYLGGPKDKAFTIIMLDTANKGSKLGSELLLEESLRYLKNKKMGDVMAAEQIATFETLKRNKLPVRSIILDKIDEKTAGMLMMHFTLETIITGKLLGINPFDQPAVEEGKIIARKLLESK